MHVLVSILIAGLAQLRVIDGFRLAQVLQFQVGDLVCRGICGNRICGRTSGDMCFCDVDFLTCKKCKPPACGMENEPGSFVRAWVGWVNWMIVFVFCVDGSKISVFIISGYFSLQFDARFQWLRKHSLSLASAPFRVRVVL